MRLLVELRATMIESVDNDLMSEHTCCVVAHPLVKTEHCRWPLPACQYVAGNLLVLCDENNVSSHSKEGILY